MKRYLFPPVLLIAVLFTVRAAWGGTIYVDAANEGGTENGDSWETAWGTIQEGVADLLASNAVTAGGHIMLVETGEYSGAAISLSSSHSGTSGNPNTLQGLTTGGGRVRYTSSGSCFSMNDADYITIDGFDLTGDGGDNDWGIYMNSSCSPVTVRNCSIYWMAAGVLSYASDLSIERCNLFASQRWGVTSGQNTLVKDCVIVDNGAYGCAVNEPGSRITNCLFYANARNVYRGSSWAETQTEINDLDLCGGNIVGNPGLADLANDWNFSVVYDNSPCLNAASHGGDIGRYTNLTTVAVSNLTYYVATDGSDSSADPTNPDTPWQTISKAATAAGAGDTVVIEDGTYPETSTITINKGGSHQKPVVYRADGDVRIIPAVNPVISLTYVGDVVLDGFFVDTPDNHGIYMVGSFANTISNITVDGNDGACIYMHGGNCKNTVSGCTLTNASGTYAALYLHNYGNSGNTFRDCFIHGNNYYGFRAGTRCHFNLIERCAVYNNGMDGLYFYGYSENWDSTVQNCNIYNNRHGIQVADSAGGEVAVAVRHCTIYGNSGDGLRGKDCRPTTYLYNCIVAGNSGYGLLERESDHELRVDRCLFFNNGTNMLDEAMTALDTEEELEGALPAGSVTNVYVDLDPLFVNAAAGDLRLQASSPAIDKGDAAYAADLPTDLYGNNRIKGTGPDLGAHEWQPPHGTMIIIR